MKRYLTNCVVEMTQTQVLFDHSAESEGEEHVEELNKEDQDDTKRNSDRYSP